MKLLKVKLSELTPDKEQPRKTMEGLSELAESLRFKGQLSPIIISKDFKILDGHRRYFASRDAGMTELDAVILDDKKKLTPFLSKAYPFAINIERHGFKAFEMAESICHIYWNYFLEEYKPKSRNDNGYSEFAKYMGMSKTQVGEILKTYNVAKKSKPLQIALKKKEIAFSTLKEIAKAPTDEHTHYIDVISREQRKPIPDRTHLRDMIRDERSRVNLEHRDELNVTYIGRVRSNSKDLKSLLNSAVIKLANEEQVKQLKACLKPIVLFYSRL